MRIHSWWLLLPLAVGFHPPSAIADEYSRFTIPSHRWSSWSADVGGWWNSSHETEPDRDSRTSELQGRLGTTWVEGFDSDRLRDEFSLAAEFGGLRRSFRRSTTNFPST